MEELSECHLTSNAMVEIHLSLLTKVILRLYRSNTGNMISFHSLSLSWLISPMRLWDLSSLEPVTIVLLVVVKDAILDAVRCAVFNRFQTLSLADNWGVMDVLMYLN